MKIRKEQLLDAIGEVSEALICQGDVSVSKIAMLMASKYMVATKFEEMCNIFLDTEGMINIDYLEKYGMEFIDKLGRWEIKTPVGTLSLDRADFVNAFNIIKQKGV